MYDGLIESTQKEKTFEKNKKSQNTISANLAGKIALKLFGKGVDLTAQTMYEHLKAIEDDEMVKDVQKKIMHDNAFDQLEMYLKEKNLLEGNDIGKFISIEDEFYIFDISFYQRLFEENGFVSLLEDIQRDTIQKEAENKVAEENREMQRNKNFRNRVQEIVKDTTEKNEKEFQSAKKLINMLANIIPYPQILCIGNYAVVLNEKYLRDDLETAAFKYGGKIRVVGYITNKITAQANTPISVFSGIGNSINALIKIFFENVDEMYLIHPVAIYYDN